MARYTSCHPTPYSSALLATQIIFVLLATIAVSLRLFSSYKADGRAWHHADSWLIVAALMLCYGLLIECIVACAMTGINCYRSDVDPSWATYMVMKFSWINFFLVVPASALSKLSCLEFYKRVFVTIECKWACNVTICLIAAWGIAAVVAQGFSDTPVSASWNPDTQEEYANYNYSIFALAIFGIDIGLDLLVLCMPIPAVVKSHMPIARRVKVAGIFAVGSFCLVCSTLRLYYAEQQVSHAYRNVSEKNTFESYTLLWSGLEPLATIVAASLPTFGPLVCKRCLPSLLHSAAMYLTLRSPKKSKMPSDLLSPETPRLSAVGHHPLWPNFNGEDYPHHHASIHSNPRPLSHLPAPGQISVTSEFSVDRERTRDSGAQGCEL